MYTLTSPARAPEIKSADADVTEAFESFMSAFEDYKQHNDQRLAEIERRGSTDVVTEEKMARIDRSLDEQKRALDRLMVKQARPSLGGGVDRETSAVRQAFDAYVRRGDEAALRQTELKAMSAGSDAGWRLSGARRARHRDRPAGFRTLAGPLDCHGPAGLGRGA